MSTQNEPPIGAEGTLDDVNIADNEVPFFDVLLSAEDADGNVGVVEQTDGSLKVAVQETTQEPLKAEDQPFDVSAERVGVDIEAASGPAVDVGLTEVSPIFAQTSTPGEYAELDTGPVRQVFDIYYDVATTDDSIDVQVSADGTNWRDHTIIDAADVNTGGQLLQMTTAYQHVRARAGSAFTDADVQVVEITAKGV